MQHLQYILDSATTEVPPPHLSWCDPLLKPGVAFVTEKIWLCQIGKDIINTMLRELLQ